ncbi:hypothetical protein N8I74_15480 [Chitiniphilus purpureus]|uniref:LysM domain-containing protein n=1 Tax=Chitiniphilus purpureus TaxID=2981137 RepID=A0ABY6DNM0_9NEIS|nr:hypothetical protein [Chitiniphilus sp. CD1]UXY14706.1 hypothetical protein N8I74_15480 [Chitiniphilus sp. CD1]
MPFRVGRAVLALGGALLCVPVHAATLGELSVRSALGERFEGVIPVLAAPDEILSRPCFQLLPGDAEGGASPLLRARLVYEPGAGGGVLRIFGDEKIQEPVLGIRIGVACPTDLSASFRRDYTVLLDPREYVAPATVPGAAARAAAPARSGGTAARRTVPALGGVWRTEGGESVERIARRYYPNDPELRAWLIDEIHTLNEGLPQNSRAPLEAGQALYLPPPRARSAREDEDSSSQVLPPVRQTAAAAPTLSIDPLPPLPDPRDHAGERLPPAAAKDDGKLQLRLSAPAIDLEYRSGMTPEETLRLRENLLLLESDDQTAQLMQLKYQIAQLEQQLDQLKSRGVQAAAPSSPASSIEESLLTGGIWMWGGLLALLLLPTGYLFWRWRERRLAQEYEPFSIATNLEPRFATNGKPVTGFGEQPSIPGSGMRELAHNIAQMANDWQQDEVDVVLPGNVSEEAQLLIDHGLVQQAVNLLSHEIEQHPTALVLWMKLFDVLRLNDMTQQFQERAVAFRLQFASDALWQQVQELGRDLDPDNPLYQPLEESDDVPAAAPSRAPAAASARPAGPGPIEFTPMLPTAEPMTLEMPPAEPEMITVEAVPSSGEPEAITVEDEPFTLEPETTAIQADVIEADTIDIVATPAADEPFEPVDVAAPQAPGAGEPLFTPADFLISEVAPVQAEPGTNVDPAEFVSDDPLLRPVSDLLAKGDTGRVFRLLEETLYNGTLEQRQIALKWLDRLFPIKHR